MWRALHEWNRRHFWLTVAIDVATVVAFVVLLATGILPPLDPWFVVMIVATLPLSWIRRRLPWGQRNEWLPPERGWTDRRMGVLRRSVRSWRERNAQIYPDEWNFWG